MFWLLLTLGCKAPVDRGQPPPTPEAVLQSASAGDTVTVQGKVFAVTFDSHLTSENVRGDRWVLIRSGGRPPGTTLGDLDGTQMLAAWGLGLRIPQDALEARTMKLPQIGDVVRATGTFRQGAWNGTTRPVLEDLSSLKVMVGVILKDVGEACTQDMDCDDDLICARATHTCATLPEPIHWGSTWHDVNGACDTDADCPVGQHCDPAYAIKADGPYALAYHREDTGRHLCVPDASTPEAACPRILTSADLAGGRFVQGKEVCIGGSAIVAGNNEGDGDTHLQLRVEEPLVYPDADLPYALFGAVTETGPPYKDATRPGGRVPDPATAQTVIVLGTYRYDGGHQWFEVHPNKQVWGVRH